MTKRKFVPNHTVSLDFGTIVAESHVEVSVKNMAVKHIVGNISIKGFIGAGIVVAMRDVGSGENVVVDDIFHVIGQGVIGFHRSLRRFHTLNHLGAEDAVLTGVNRMRTGGTAPAFRRRILVIRLGTGGRIQSESDIARFQGGSCTQPHHVGQLEGGNLRRHQVRLVIVRGGVGQGRVDLDVIDLYRVATGDQETVDGGRAAQIIGDIFEGAGILRESGIPIAFVTGEQTIGQLGVTVRHPFNEVFVRVVVPGFHRGILTCVIRSVVAIFPVDVCCVGCDSQHAGNCQRHQQDRNRQRNCENSFLHLRVNPPLDFFGA